MYSDIGTKIKKMVEFVVGAGIAFFVIWGIIAIISQPKSLSGLLIIIIGPLLCWLSGFILYGFGELVDKVCAIEKHLQSSAAKKQLAEEAETEISHVIPYMKEENTWVCPECCREHAACEKTCKCGYEIKNEL